MSSTKWLIGLLIIVALVLGVMSLEREREPGPSSEELIEADRTFAAETLARGGNGWAEFFVRDGIMFPPSGRVDGREAIRERMLPVFAPDQPLLLWEPDSAVIAKSGDLGYTIGRWKSVGTDSTGANVILAEGNYVTMWKKDDAGVWRVALDIGNRDSE
jgi:ketosteroid isomerase-like protein